MKDPFLNSSYRPLPQETVTLLRQVAAPPRLVAHLILVHDVAATLIDRLLAAFPEISLRREEVLFGASIHDIGKATNRSELIRSGAEHERRGLELLRSMGVSAERARFAYTHGNWDTEPNVKLEDLVVALADKCWKGKRVDELESKIAALLSVASTKPEWQCFAELDKIIQELTNDADERLTWQGAFEAS
jgi:putative nucleotidyltransferase with HDIG domain